MASCRSQVLGLCLLLMPSLLCAQTKSLVIGIDGLGYGNAGFDAADTPWLDSLIQGTFAGGSYNGAYTDQAIAGGVTGAPTQQPTVSGPGWSSILTGVWKDQHGVTGNNFAGRDYVNNPPYLGTLKTALPDITTASYTNWEPIDEYIISAVDADTDPDNDLDFRGTYDTDLALAIAAAQHIADPEGLDTDAVFVEFDDVDIAGHACGSSGGCYLRQIEETDGLVGRLLSGLQSRPNFADEDWQIVVTADHGHRPSGGHGGQSELEKTIPFVVASKTLRSGTLPAFPQVVSHTDVAPTVLEHFGVDSPGNYWGVSRAGGGLVGNLDINRDGIVAGDGTGPWDNDDVTAFVSYWLQPNTLENPNPADLNLDGVTDITDWALLNAADPSTGEAIASVIGVPEPSAGALALVFAFLVSTPTTLRRLAASARVGGVPVVRCDTKTPEGKSPGRDRKNLSTGAPP